MIDSTQIDSIFGGTVYDTAGEKIGTIAQVYLDDTTGQPDWATVQTGLFGTKESFVPLAQATLADEAGKGDVTVPFSKDQVKNAPRVDADEGHLTPDEESELYRYYGLNDTSAPAKDSSDHETTAPVADDVSGGDVDGRSRGGTDTSGPNTDEAMTRSEEQLKVGTQKVETGKARLRKYVVTEQQTVTVPVTREEVRVEREPITDTNRDQALSGPAISEEEHEIVLHEEQVVVSKEAVPVERVALARETVTEEKQVTEDVRKEQIETDGVDDLQADQRK